MAQYTVHAMLVSLNIMDTPVGYTPPRGPDMKFTVTYNQRDANQPANFSYSNLGPKWTFNWLSYVTEPSTSDDPTDPDPTLGASRIADRRVAVRVYMPGGGAERHAMGTPHAESRGVLVRLSAGSYERRLPDGSKEILNLPEGATAPRKVFMTAMIDPAGNTIRFTYDAQRRLMAVTDALGQVTRLSYDLAADARKITRVTDPFGRSATFEYDGRGRLWRITDVIGITSAFSYEGESDFINALTTPYGTTRFTKGEDVRANSRFLEATDPLGDKERIEFRHQAPGIPFSETVVPSGIESFNQYIDRRNTFYWDKKTMREHPGDYTRARLLHWLHDGELLNVTSNILESEKAPLENRVWYNYPGQGGAHRAGPQAQRSKVARVLDDGATQLYQFEYNAMGRVTKFVDPVGRTFTGVYAPNQIDLVELRQTRGSNNELLAKFTYNAQHRPLTFTDAAGQMTTYSYNAAGQLLTARNARNETTTLTYDTSGYLVQVDWPMKGARTTLTYDSFGRVATVTDSEGYTLTYDYDNLDRRTQITYPDGTVQQRTHDRLDLASVTDRLGRTTRYRYDALRRLISIQDPLNRTTQFEWCRCGGLGAIIDPLGRRTSFEYDVRNRLIEKLFADGSKTSYTYENTTSRLKEMTDVKKQTTNYLYNVDDTFRQIRYSGPGVTTPAVGFTYDPDYYRARTMQDGTGTTTYSYYPITATPALGAGQLSGVSGPLPNSAITYTYDELGRLASRAIGSVAERVTYDALGRVTQATNPLGDFGYSYVNTTNRLQTIDYPNGQSTTFSYYDNQGDQRLQQIQNLDSNKAMLSQFDYSYDLEGQVATWSKQVGTLPPRLYGFEYDAAGQLLTAAPQSMGGGLIANQFLYQYDPAGNRTLEQIDATATPARYNNLNQIVSQQVAVLPEPDPVMRESEFTYDGLQRRVRMVEREDSVVVSDKRFVWCDRQICEERDGTGATVTKRFYSQGMVIVDGPNAGNYYYTRDHLGSIREMTHADGAVQAQYDYDPYGRVVSVVGDLDGDFGFTGHYFHPASGLNLALYRAYDPNLGRWSGRDPLGEGAGTNLYAYVGNNPINFRDRLGLFRTLQECQNDCEAKLLGCYGSNVDVLWTLVQGLGFGQGVAVATAARGAAGMGMLWGASWAAAKLNAKCLGEFLGCQQACFDSFPTCGAPVERWPGRGWGPAISE